MNARVETPVPQNGVPPQVLQHLLVATDGSDNGDRAATYALALALRHRGDVLLCYAVDHAAAIAECSSSNGGTDLFFPLVAALDDAAAAILADAAKRAAHAGVVAQTVELDGRSAQAIVNCAKDRRIDAIVMGTQGKRGFERFMMGSTADGVLRRTDVPVFVVPPGASGADAAFGRILIAVDDSDPSDAAVAFALGLASADSSSLIFCSVAETSDVLEKAAYYGGDSAPMREELRAATGTLLAAQTDRAGLKNIPSESVLAEGEPVEEVLKTAQARQADLIVVGTHGRRGLRRLMVGSVAEGIVRRSPVPVAVVRAASEHNRT